MGSNNILYDGDFSRPNPVGSPRVVYPFQQLGDRVTKGFEQDYWQLGATYEPPLLGTPNPTDRTLFVVAATSPDRGIGDINIFTLTWTRVPGNQVSGASQPITKPSPGTYGVAAGAGYVLNNTGTFLGNGAVFYGGYLFGYNQVYGPYTTATSVNSGGNTRVTATAHGITGSETIAFTTSVANQGMYIFLTAQYTVIDANTIDLLGINLGTNGTTIGKYYRAYTAGNDRVGVRLTQKFYLPGVTSGITTFGDIPIPAPLLNDIDFLNAVLANPTGYLNYDSTDLGFWGSSIIYTQTLREINMADI